MAEMSDTVTIYTRCSPSARRKRNAWRSTENHGAGQAGIVLASRYLRTWRVLTVVSSTVLRIASFMFLRWIPGHHLVPAVLFSFLLYLVSFTVASRPPPPQTPEDVIADRYTAAYQRLQENRRRRDTEEFERWQKDDKGLRRRQRGSIDEPALSQESLDSQSSPPSSLLTRSLTPLSKPMQSIVSLFLTPPRSILSLSTNSATTSRRKSLQSSKSLPYASDTSPAGLTETILTGLPNSASRLWSAATMIFNVLLALMVFDLVLRAPLLHASHDLAFARSGFVDEKSARVLVREPDKAQMPLSVSYHVAESSRWTTTGRIAAIGEDVDFTHAFTLSPLKSATKYEYATSNGHNGTFTTAPKVGHPRMTFLTTSCLKPRVPYNILHHPLQLPGLDALASLLPKLHASFMLFLGDFIYVDVPFRFGWQASNYRREYRQVYASPSWGPVSQNLPWLHVIDDHEIANDWDRGVRAPYPAAIDPFSIYHHSVNPPAATKNETFYTFRHGPASFFLLDTRRHRTPSTPLAATHPNKTILGTQQRHALLSWLGQHEPGGVKWKILVSSVPLTRNWRTNAVDTWGGYLVERQLVLESMWDAAAKGFGVVTVSGDRHEFAATRFPAPVDGERSEHSEHSSQRSQRSQAKRKPTTEPNARSHWGSPSSSTLSKRWQHPTTKRAVAVWEFSCSPLSMFYLPIRTYREKKGETSGVGASGEDQMIAYLPVGNSKVGAVDIGLEKDDNGKITSVLRYRLFVDGKEGWAYGVDADGREGREVGMGVVDS